MRYRHLSHLLLLFESESFVVGNIDRSLILMRNLYRINGWKCGVNLIFSRNLRKKQNGVKPTKNEEFISRYFNMQFVCVRFGT
jgi:hypothetical protein